MKFSLVSPNLLQLSTIFLGELFITSNMRFHLNTQRSESAQTKCNLFEARKKNASINKQFIVNDPNYHSPQYNHFLCERKQN